MTWQSFFKSKGTTWLLVAVLIFVLFITVRVFVQKREVDKQIQKLVAETEKVKRTDEQLSGLIKYLNTPEYQEKAAREQLNLKKAGEYVVVLPSNADSADNAQTNADSRSNARKWFDYFFNAK
jgi:cell division protein FtsB